MTFSRKDVPCARWNTMSFEFIKKLPTPAEIRKELPLPAELVRIKEARDAEIRDVLTGKSNKFLVIIGPCSADNEDSVCDYVNRLAKVNEKVKDKLILVPRIYTNKPRTTGEGYKGITSQPDPEKKPDFLAGLMAMRKMHIRAIKETGLTAADEMLYPENWGYVSDILSYVAIGARSVEDQQHRLTVSGFDVAAGMKNPACVIDANHSNSNKQFREQIRITKEVMHSRKLSPDLHKLVKGVMIESYIEEGNQKVGAGCYGKSITDPCLGWEDSERLIYDIAEYE